MQSITPTEQVHQPVKGNSPLPIGQPDWLRLLLQKRNTRKGMLSERNTYTRITYRGEYTPRGIHVEGSTRDRRGTTEKWYMI